MARQFIMRNDSPSDTSLLVARSILLASQDVRLQRLLAPGEAEMLGKVLTTTGGAPWFDFVLRNGWARRILFFVEHMMVAGIIVHYLARKRWIEGKVRETLVEGVRQVIVLGAGFDTLAARLSTEFPQVLFLEIDHPATQSMKQNLPDIAPNLHLLPVDLATQPLAGIVGGCPRFLTNQPAVIIAEGLTMYLTAARVSAMLRDSADLAGPGGRVIFTFMEQAEDGSIGFRGENPLWGISRAALPAWLGENGLRGESIASDRDLRGEILAPRGLADITLARGECLCSCSPTIR